MAQSRVARTALAGQLGLWMEHPHQDDRRSGDKEEDSIIRYATKREDVDQTLPNAPLPWEAEVCERT